MQYPPLSSTGSQSSNVNKTTNDLDLKLIVLKYLRFWKWYLLSILIFLFIAFVYIRYSIPQYNITTSILIKDEKKGGTSEMSAFSDLNIFSGYRNNVLNELYLLKSRTISQNAVKALDFDITYSVEGRVLNPELYTDSPIKVVFVQKNDNYYEKDTLLVVKSVNANQFELVNGNNQKAKIYNFGAPIKTTFGHFIVLKNKNYDQFSDEIKVVKHSLVNVANNYRSKIDVNSSDKSSIIEINLVDRVEQKGIDFLNKLIEEYNNDATVDKNMVANNTSKFIDTRLAIITSELGDVESEVENFKKQNRLTDLKSDSQLQLGKADAYETSVVEIETQIKLIQSVIDEVAKIGFSELIPNNVISFDTNSSAVITTYNGLILDKRRLLKSASPQNPAVVRIEDQISGLRSSINTSLKNTLSTLKLKRADLQKQENKFYGKVAEVPTHEKKYRIIDRQQKIKESLYLYLLQKREETQISLAVTSPKAKVIDLAYTTGFIMPNKNIFYTGAILLGILLTTMVLFVIDFLDTKIKSREDIVGKTNVPYLGDIPKSDSSHEIIQINSRSSSAEAIRIVRTNLEFMLTQVPSESCKTIFVTSTLPNEGKTFISANLAATIAQSSKKVLIIGMDIRNPKLNEYINFSSLKGLTNYLTEENGDINDYIVKVEGFSQFYVLPSGVIPPNPTELLMNNKMSQLFEVLRKDFDYIIADTAPVSLVADTLLVAKNADAFVYVMRANYLDKKMISIADNLYLEQKLPNMSILLNDTDLADIYGYGYGYGVDMKKKTFIEKLFNK